MMKRIVALAIAVVLVILMVIRLIHNRKKIEAGKNPPKLEVRIPVKVMAARKEPWVFTIVKTGTVMPWQESSIMAMQPGQVTEVLFEMADRVREGQVLALTDIRQKELSRQSLELAVKKLSDDLARAEKLKQGEAMTEAQYREIKFQKENTEIQLAQVKQQIDDSRILAPISGIVTMKNINKGEFVNPGMPLGRISDISKLKVHIKLTAVELRLVSEGDKVNVILDNSPMDTLTGIVSAINPRADQAQNFLVEVMLPNPDLKLKAGGFATVIFAHYDLQPVLTLPSHAFNGSVALGRIFVIEDSVARERKVLAGRILSNKVEILSGLSEGETVVITGQNNLSDGTAVRLIKD
jgi:RND family efflux transporter MFP subunit